MDCIFFSSEWQTTQSTGNKCMTLGGEGRKVCVRDKRAEGKTIIAQMILARCPIGHNMNTCPNHGLAEGLLQYSSVHIDTIVML